MDSDHDTRHVSWNGLWQGSCHVSWHGRWHASWCVGPWPRTMAVVVTSWHTSCFSSHGSWHHGILVCLMARVVARVVFSLAMHHDNGCGHVSRFLAQVVPPWDGSWHAWHGWPGTDGNMRHMSWLGAWHYGRGLWHASSHRR